MMRLARWLVVGLLAVQAGWGAPATIAPDLKFEKYTLANGLDVILYQDHRLPLVAVNLWYHVGSANERPGRTGFAHLFEHMMFGGSAHVGAKEHFHYLEEAGASDINGSTELDRTNYYETLPSNQLQLTLWLESDRMGYLLQGLDPEKLANQRDVVRNERRQSIENVPYGMQEEKLYHLLFPKEHPYYPYVIGSHADLEAARLADVREFFRQYYSPNNASLVITGDFDPAPAKALVEKYFATIPRGPEVPKITAVTPAITAERRAVVYDQIELPRVMMGWLMPQVFKPGDAETKLLAQLLGGGKSSRLYKKLVYEKQIAQDVTASSESLILGSVFEIQATAKPGVKPEELEKAIDEELEKLRREGPSAAELARARNVIQSGIIRRLERLDGLADRLNRYNHYLGDPGYLARDLARYDNATVAAVAQLAQEKLGRNGRAVVYCVKGKKEVDDPPRTEEKETAKAGPAENPMPEEAWRKQPPAAGPASRLALPVPARFQLANGLTVLVAEQHALPVVSASLVVASGQDANPVEQPGLASFTASMLEEGTERRSALAVADDVDQIGAALSVGSGVADSEASLRVLKPNLEAGMDLLADVVLHPKFATEEIARVREQRLAELVQVRDDPFQTAISTVERLVYGAGHPYGYREVGTEASNRAATHAALEKFWKQAYVPANTALVLAGDVTEAEARALAEKYFGGWTAAGSRRQVPPVENHSTRAIYLVDKPGANQSVVVAGGLGAPRSTPDYVPLEVTNNVLGGLFSSRLNLNLREQHGYSYGAFSAFAYRRGSGVFFAGGSVRADATAPAAAEVLKELERLRTAAPTTEEMKLARGAFALSLAALFETSGQTAETIGNLFTYDLPQDYWQQVGKQADLVQATEVQRVAQKYLQPEATFLVVVGDRKTAEPELKKLGWPLELRNEDGEAVK
jgi:zinc protease